MGWNFLWHVLVTHDSELELSNSCAVMASEQQYQVELTENLL